MFSCTRHPWTPSEEKKLRQLVEANKGYDPIPWQHIAISADMGHNSGSCKAKFESLANLLWPGENNLTFTGAAGGGKVVLNANRAL